MAEEQATQEQDVNAGLETPAQQEQPASPNWPPKGFENNPVATRYKTIDEAAKALEEKENFIQQSVRIPGQDAKPEDWEKFYSKLRPEKPEDYELSLKVPNEKGEEIDFQPNEQQQKVIEQYRKLAHKHGISKQQFNGFLQDQLNEEMQQAKEQEQFDKKLLEQNWGSDYHRNVALSNQAFKSMSEGAQQALSKLSLKDRYEILHSVGVMNLEDEAIHDGKSSEQTKGNLEALEKQLEEKQREHLKAPTHQKKAVYSEILKIKEQIFNLKGQK
ncbi:hypothetical protein GWO43_01265 [candidate division KSB1 bacterium]|nr:hypothetical protein [candidate division KSB1 bacterium]NIS22700.1 hypothetical protein [candidate division KSB1 bacterium]NIT69548.1 hypothetical protein [candidate division KSB1 bacterium]NIU23202.1 hypothetical protein [candidate division KSB1 bacterium]NIU90364.1 hypothetical protein [candidate division KSB1 bacterium]